MKLDAAALVASGPAALGASTAGALLRALGGTANAAAPDTPTRMDLGLMAALLRVGEVAVGEFTGTQAAQDVALGFDPVFVLIANITDGDTIGLAFNTQNVGTKSFSIVLATAGVASEGILFGAAGTKKFSLGTSAVLNETDKVYQYLAIGY